MAAAAVPRALGALEEEDLSRDVSLAPEDPSVIVQYLTLYHDHRALLEHAPATGSSV